jgi:uncharacterized membrane protein YkoI
MRKVLLALLAAATMAAAPVAEARHGRRGDDRGAQGPVNISHDQAVAIARQNGLVRVRETDLRDGLWKVEGWHSNGRTMEIRISAATGAVVKLEFYS